MKKISLSCLLMAVAAMALALMASCSKEEETVKLRGQPVSFSNADVGNTVKAMEKMAEGVKEKGVKLTYLQTAAFEVPSDQWFLDWQFETKPKVPPFAVQFNIRAYPEGEDVVEVGSARAVSHSSSGRNYFYQGKGKYYLKIRSRLLEGWKVDVKPWALDPLAPPLTLEGNSTADTQPFKIKAKEGKIKWIVKGIPSLVGTTGGGALDIYRVGQTGDYVKRFVASPDRPGEGAFPGKGEYFIRVEAGGVWKLDISE
ncbi:MAG: hypothetical protein V2J25_13805 [Desulfatiglans sp.]|jgi:hypothetical protein|nr:hypothetical protein [Thermodesulfobacteriota bacterium]MEE4353931.1 hypothetical protein [Desulfatiglans sp.]